MSTADVSVPAQVQPPLRVVLQREAPSVDVQIDVKRSGSFRLVTIEGRISETFHGEELGRRLMGDVLLDTTRVDRVTSFGVRSWLAMLEAMDADRLVFARCSEAVISQITMIRAFSGNARIASFFAPYLCESCGNAFSVLYDAIDDAAAIEARSPIDVPCPRCRASCTLDDDPDDYLAVPSLLTERDEALAQALARLEALGDDAEPVQKSLRGDVTVVRFNARLDAALRLRRVFDGLEGNIRLELGGIPEVTSRGLATFLRALEALDPAVRQATLVGCPEELAEALVERAHDPRVRVDSVVVTARCDSPAGRRPAFVELDEHQERLLDGLPPLLRCGWCDEPVTLDSSLEALIQLAERRSGQRRRDLRPPPPPSAAPRMLLWSAAAFALLGGAATGAVLLLGLGLFAWYATGDAPPALPADAWIADRTPPPAWTEQPSTVGDEGAVLIAAGEGPDVESATRAARDQAILALLGLLDQALADPARPQLRAAAPATHPRPEAVVSAYLREVGAFATPAREEVAVRQGAQPVRVIGRYRVTPEAWTRLVAYYREAASFRGLTLGRLPPHHDDGGRVLVVATASWLAEPRPGDRLLRVGERQVVDLRDAVALLEREWARLPSTDALELHFSRDGAPHPVRLQKGATR